MQNPEMQRKFYYQTYKSYMHICVRYAPNIQEAELWVNDAYIKIFANHQKYVNNGSLEGWLKKLVINTCLDNLRQLKAQYNTVHIRTKDTSYIGEDYSTTNTAMLQMDSQQLLNLIQTLPTTQRTVFNLYAIEGYTHKEIAEQLNIKEANSQWHLNQARNFLKNKLATANKLVK
jgi:RNA polymerase sigma factor (sigma-70 family)